MASILVTGSSGFLGGAIVSRLETQGHRVVGLDPKPPGIPLKSYIADDLSETGSVHALLSQEKITHVVHAGGVSGPMVMANEPDRVISINVAGTLNLLMAAISARVQTFLYCSSVSAIGNFYESAPIGEDYPLRPDSAYGASKAAVDILLRGLWRKVPVDLCSLRFTGIYGPGRKTRYVIDDIVGAALIGGAVRCGPSSDWPYIYIDDAADAAIAACFSTKRQNLIYYIAYPEQVSLDALIAAATEAAGPVALEIDPAQPHSMRGPLDIKPAIRDFSFEPRIDHREGIRRLVETRRGHIAPPS